MADLDVGRLINPGDLASSFWQNAPPELLTKWLSLLDIGKIAGVVIIVYFVVLIIARILKFRDSRNIRLIKNEVMAINRKFDSLVRKPEKKESKEKSKKK
jgi:hypothetical protein